MSIKCDERLTPVPGRLWILGFVKTRVPDDEGQYEVYVWREGPTTLMKQIFITKDQFHPDIVEVMSERSASDIIPALKASLKSPYCYDETPGSVHAMRPDAARSAWFDFNLKNMENTRKAVAIVDRRWPPRATEERKEQSPKERLRKEPLVIEEREEGEEQREQEERKEEEGQAEERKEAGGEEERTEEEVRVRAEPADIRDVRQVLPTKSEAALLTSLGLKGARLLATTSGPKSGLEAVRIVVPYLLETDAQLRSTAAFFASTRLSQLRDDAVFHELLAAYGHLEVEDVCRTVANEAYALRPDDVRALLWLSDISAVIVDATGRFLGDPANPLTRRVLRRLREPAPQMVVMFFHDGRYRVVSQGDSDRLADRSQATTELFAAHECSGGGGRQPAFLRRSVVA